jgi:sodium-independent sulfate anion transporter 11
MPGETATKIGHGLAKVLGIKLQYRDPLGTSDHLTRGESTFSSGTADTYIEPEPTSAEWLYEHVPSRHDVLDYLISLFPFLSWIGRYNLQWFIGDLVAGVTVGAVVVPQGMAYAKLADLPVEYGLYASFMGVLIYWFFATSKDITIGPVAVMSTLTGNIIIEVQKSHPEFSKPEIAQALSIIAGAIVTFIGLIRWGFIVDFIPLTAISAFMTGSAINIASGQVKSLLGETANFSTRGATYEIIINTLKHLPSAKVDAAMGLTALFMLYGIRSACNYGARRNPQKAKLFFFLSTLRTVFVILFYTMISAAVNLHRRDDPAFSLLGHVPRGFQHAGVPTVTRPLIASFATNLPSAVIVLLIEHIAISKSFGRVNNYVINPSQEMVAIGVTNLLGPFVGGYPATGSFSRTAIKSKAGVRTPLAGLITAIVVLLAIYALPAVFFYIPSSSLSGVIIHAVGDLITPPNTVYQFWLVSPFDVIIFFAGVFVTIFSSIENGVYTTICISAALLLWRIVKARGDFLGKVRVHSVLGDHLLDSNGKYGTVGQPPVQASSGSNDPDNTFRNVYLPVRRQDGSNPQISVEHPYPGVFIYRFSEGFVYPNANHETDYLVSNVFKETRRTNLESYPTLGDRPWNNPGPRRGKVEEDRSQLPCLRAVILDFSSVNNVDVTSVQNLIDVRNQLDHYASPDPVQWHFAYINNRWTKRALASAGFGYPSVGSEESSVKRWKPIFSVAELGGIDSAAAVAERERLEKLKTIDPEHGGPTQTEQEHNHPENSSNDSINYQRQLKTSTAYEHGRRIALVSGINLPLFHVDITSALQSAIANAKQYETRNKLVDA